MTRSSLRMIAARPPADPAPAPPPRHRGARPVRPRPRRARHSSMGHRPGALVRAGLIEPVDDGDRRGEASLRFRATDDRPTNQDCPPPTANPRTLRASAGAPFEKVLREL